MPIFHRLMTSLFVRNANRQLHKRGLHTLLAKAPDIAKPANPIEAWWLYRDISERKPRHIVELGCGYSTLIILAAIETYRLPNGARAKFTGIDANADWMRAWGDIPTSYAPIEQCSVGGTKAHRYAVDPPKSIDYMFIDGPSPRDVPDWTGQPMSADAILWRNNLSKNCRIVVEGREQNVALLKAHLQDAFTIKENPPLRWTTFDARRQLA